jgi:hypothetical protein
MKLNTMVLSGLLLFGCGREPGSPFHQGSGPAADVEHELVTQPGQAALIHRAEGPESGGLSSALPPGWTSTNYPQIAVEALWPLGTGKLLAVGPLFSLYDPSNGTWSTPGEFFEFANFAESALLSNGTVLRTGGMANSGPDWSPRRTDIYVPQTGLWNRTGPMRKARSYFFSLTALEDGKALAVGGYGPDGEAPGGVLRSAEIYDSITGWNEVASLHEPRASHTATLMMGGNVLVLGGTAPGGEIFDRSLGAWTRTAPWHDRWGHTATLLQDGRVLVVGGRQPTGAAIDSVEIYEPKTKAWGLTGKLNFARSGHSAILLGNGKVLVAGGANNSTPLRSAELYDPATGLWTRVEDTHETHGFFVHASLLADGNALVLSGSREEGAEMYNTLGACGPIAVGPTLPPGRIGQPYAHSLSASGNSGNTSWSMVGGTLPPGITLNTNGDLTGQPTLRETFSFTARAINGRCAGEGPVTLVVRGPGSDPQGPGGGGVVAP